MRSLENEDGTLNQQWKPDSDEIYQLLCRAWADIRELKSLTSELRIAQATVIRNARAVGDILEPLRRAGKSERMHLHAALQMLVFKFTVMTEVAFVIRQSASSRRDRGGPDEALKLFGALFKVMDESDDWWRDKEKKNMKIYEWIELLRKYKGYPSPDINKVSRLYPSSLNS
jgi:hypothetical protein